MAGATLLTTLLAAALLHGPAAAAGRPALTVFAASDLAPAFEVIAPRFERATGARVTLVFGSTGNLARQVEEGAPADVFFAANVAFVEGLERAGALRPETRTLYARGRLVLAWPKGSEPLAGLADLARPQVRRVAIANPEHAPYGQAAREALESAGLWERLRSKLVYGENVRQALQLVESGAVEAGLLARSVAGVPGVAYVPVDPARHRPIDQAAAVTARSRALDLARAFIAFVTGPEGLAVLERYGFDAPRDGG